MKKKKPKLGKRAKVREVSEFIRYYVNVPVYLADDEYDILDFDELLKITRETYEKVKAVLKKYKLETEDCDDWALLFYALAKVKTVRAIGMAWSNFHAFCVSITMYKGEPRFVVIEPQQGEIYFYEEISKENPKYYKITRFVLM